MTDPSPPTIIDLKSAFLSTQIRALSLPLQASPSFLASNADLSVEEHALRQKNINDALHKLNERLKRHNKLNYAPQAQRHVAEQVDSLYWAAGERGVVTLSTGEQWVERGNDYRQEAVIADLPPSWPGAAESQAPVEAQKFSALQQRLVELNEKRAQAKKRLENHRRMKGLVDMFTEDAGVQENLVGRNSEVELELEKMRRLIARVERGMVGIEGSGGGGDEMDEMDVDVDLEKEEEKKVLAILG